MNVVQALVGSSARKVLGGIGRGLAIAFLIFCFFGVIGVVIDLDHILCLAPPLGHWI